MSRRCAAPAASQNTEAGQFLYHIMQDSSTRDVENVTSAGAVALDQPQQRSPASGRHPHATNANRFATGPSCTVEIRDDRDLTQDAFDKMLAILDHDRDAAGRKYEIIHRKLQKFFECRGCSTPCDLADETINLVARKIARGQQIIGDELARYFYGVARNVIRGYWRHSARFGQSTESLTPAYHPSEDPVEAARLTLERRRSDRRIERLERCLRTLTDENREAIIKYYGCEGGSKISGRRMLAREMGIHSNALRLRVHRIKMKLKRDLDEWIEYESHGPIANHVQR